MASVLIYLEGDILESILLSYFYLLESRYVLLTMSELY